MSLDLNRTTAQIEGMADDLRARQSEREQRVNQAVGLIKDFPVDEYRRRLEQSNEEIGGFFPTIREVPDSLHTPPQVLDNFCVAAVDGSHIDVNRHLPVRCFLVNTGVSVLTYGSSPGADLFNSPRLFAREEDLVIRDPATAREQAIEGAVLGAKRAAEEVRALVDVVRSIPKDTSTLALLDGTLLVLGLSGPRNQDFVLRELIEEGFAAALDDLREMADRRQLAVASYISMPGSAEVVNALRVAACQYGPSQAELRCGIRGPGRTPCQSCVGGVLDRDIFARLLRPGERSAVFATSSPLVDRYYRGAGLCFFYIHVGEEIGRVEIPSWVADESESLGLVHSIILDQCRRGQGYPVALMEAHEQAIVRGPDRRYFDQLIGGALQDKGVPVYESEKSRSKRVRMA